MSVITEIMETPYDQEIVFDYAVDPGKYMELRRFMSSAGSDLLACVPPRIVISKNKWFLDGYPPENEYLGEAFGRYFLHRAEDT